MTRDLTVGLHPELSIKIRRVLTHMQQIGHPMRICSGVRTAAEQAQLWAQGRTLPGKIVTYADGIHKKSNHQDGKAVDCCFIEGQPFGEDQPWLRYGEAVEAAGLSWGGRWKRPDRPHAELI